MGGRWAPQLPDFSQCDYSAEISSIARGCWKGTLLSQARNDLLLFTLGTQPFQLGTIMKRERELRSAFVLEAACLWSVLQQETPGREQVWAASRHRRKIKTSSTARCLPSKCWILCQSLTLAKVSEWIFFFFQNNTNLKELVVNLCLTCWLV